MNTEEIRQGEVSDIFNANKDGTYTVGVRKQETDHETQMLAQHVCQEYIIHNMQIVDKIEACEEQGDLKFFNITAKSLYEEA